MGTTPDYRQTLEYLYEKLPMFSRTGKAALKPDLANTLRLCEAIGNPHQKIKTVHIAGTNGKGSVSHALAAMLQQSGYKTGLYTSPHLIDFRERIRINGEMVSKEWVVQFVEQLKPVIKEVKPSFFEITVVMAFAYFAEQEVDIAIIESGLGGRLDSTNVITPLLSIITNISYDHKDLLGDTLAQIASEKAGIIKEGVPVVIGEQNAETERVFFEHSVHKHSVLHYAQSLWGLVRVSHDNNYQYYKIINNATQEMLDLRTDLQGNFQQHNIKIALTAIELLRHQGFVISFSNALIALSKVKKLTELRGRWEILQRNPLIVCDVAHNIAGLTETLQQFQATKEHSEYGKMHIVVGFVRDKDIAEALAIFPKNAIYYFTNAQTPRALPAEMLQSIAKMAGLNGTTFTNVNDAFSAAKRAMNHEDRLLVTGSFFVVGEVLQFLEAAVA